MTKELQSIQGRLKNIRNQASKIRTMARRENRGMVESDADYILEQVNEALFTLEEISDEE